MSRVSRQVVSLQRQDSAIFVQVLVLSEFNESIFRGN